ncbi:hypothetical protein ACIRF8_30390 [Streptomyces sp. NPDC102406]|uniref:hypothetical protein n=1 Tax=Streptomyces sp. NPDC102406 TaxID=3366171 RepID=UPI003804E742
MPRPLSRTAIRAAVPALAAGLVALGAAAPGRAAEGDPAMTFTIGQYKEGPSTEVEPFGEFSEQPIQGHNVSGRTLKNVKVTMDLTALKGQLAVTNQSLCTQPRELVEACTYGEALKPGDSYGVAALVFEVLPGARPGFSGEISVSAEAQGVSLGTTKLTVTMADKSVLIDRTGQVPPGDPVKPGGTVRPLAGFTNFSSRPVRDVYVRLRLTPSLSFAREYSNCEYGLDDKHPAMSCHIAQNVEPGAAYDLDLGPLRLTDSALSESWYGDIFVDESAYERSKPTSSHRGSGPELTAVPRASGPTIPGHALLSGSVVADNTLDFEAVGATLDGKAGQVVTAHLGARNKGPATIKNWTGSEPGDEPTSEVRVVTPPGTTVMKAPANCREDGSSERYYCWEPEAEDYFLAGKLTPFDFDLRIDKPSALAPGKITLSHGKEDLNKKNDIAPIIVTVDGKLGDGSAPSAGGTGGTGSAAGGATATPGTGDSSASPGTGGSGTASGGTGTGSMAATGAGALPWYAAGAGVALAVGAGLFTLARRRRTARA